MSKYYFAFIVSLLLIPQRLVYAKDKVSSSSAISNISVRIPYYLSTQPPSELNNKQASILSNFPGSYLIELRSLNGKKEIKKFSNLIKFQDLRLTTKGGVLIVMPE